MTGEGVGGERRAATGTVAGVRVTHRRASVDGIAAVGSDDAGRDVEQLLSDPEVREAYVLRTCNRVEAYVVTDDRSAGRQVLSEFASEAPPDAVVETGHEESLRHLIRVAAGLESMVLGEDRILGQVRDDFETARDAGGIGPVLEEAVRKATRVGERVRTETEINDGVVSLGSAAARHLDDEVGLDGTTVALVGAGDVASRVADALADRGVERMIVVNRSLSSAEVLAEVVDTDAEAVGLDGLAGALDQSGVAVAATAATEPVVGPEDVADAGETRIVDMGQPRNVAPGVGDIEGVRVTDLDALEAVTEATRDRRESAAAEAERIVDRELDRLVDQYKRKRADEVIAAMHAGADRIREREVRTAIRKLEAEGEVTDREREVIESLAETLVSQLLAAPTKSLREAAAEDDWTTLVTALRLFDPEFPVGEVELSEIDEISPDTRAAPGSEED